MDEAVFRATRAAMTAGSCAYEKALLAGVCACALAARRNIAEREVVDCSVPAAREDCAALRALMRRNAAFALKLRQPTAPLPHAKQMKLECGGLLGLQRLLAPQTDGAPAPADVQRLVRAAAQKYGDFDSLPFSAIVQAIVAYQIRRRRPHA